MEGDFPLSRYIYEGLSALPPSLFPNYISAFQSEINGGEGSSSLQFYGGGGDNNHYGAYSLFGSHPPVTTNPIGSYNESDLMEFQRNRLQQSSFINGDYNNQNLMRSLMVSGSGLDENVVKMEQLIPKSELFDGWTNVIESTPLNMIGEGSSIPNLNTSGGVYHHHQLPVLCSLEQIISQGITITNTDDDDDGLFPVSEPALKRFRSSSSTTTDDSLSSTRDLILSNPPTTAIPFLSLSSLLKSTPSVIPSAILAREKRKMVSDRIRSLEKLMPWNKKMNMASLLEEVYKYIKFLQAQVSVLQAMPCQSSFITTSSSSSSCSSSSSHQQVGMNNNIVGGGLEKLNRQQLLKVLMNSAVAQTYLYSRGCCVYSLEQLILLKKITAHRILLQQMLMARSTSSVYSKESLP